MGQVRNLVGVGSIVPAFSGAVGWGLLTRSKRRGVNFFTTAFPQMLLTLNGVRTKVNGGENLSKATSRGVHIQPPQQLRPGDRGLVGQGQLDGRWQKELQNDPIVGTLGKLVDTVFIDRDDPKAAVESLQDAAEMVKKGLSVVIAPEGTRIDTKSVGLFKKGPFRLAMSAGVPIVPIVIRNAEVIAARNSTTLHPGTVDVVVYPPLSVANWTVDDLPERIAEVRQLYIDTLRDWPTGEVPEHDLYKSESERAAAKKAPARRLPPRGSRQEGPW